MNPSALVLLALKGTCALNCLAALHLAGPLPVTQRIIMDLTGFDENAVRKGLNTLRVLDLAICTGDKHRTAWQLAPAARSLPLPLHPFLSSRENAGSTLLKEEELSTNETDINIDSSSVIDPSNARIAEFAPAPDPAQTGSLSPALPRTLVIPGSSTGTAPPLPTQHLPLPTQNPSLPTSNQKGHQASPNTPQKTLESWSLRGLKAANPENALRSDLYQAFEAANVYLQFRRPLADALLADDGPAWLRQTLGWICYAQRRLPHVKRGAVVYISLRDRLPSDPAYLPPPELPFEAALAWALRGGEDEPEPTAESDNDVIDTGQTLGVSEILKVSASPEDDLWRAVIDKLARELSSAVIDSQLRPARLVSLDGDHCLIAAASPQSRAWLQTRLCAVLGRALTDLTGRTIKIEFSSAEPRAPPFQ